MSNMKDYLKIDKVSVSSISQEIKQKLKKVRKKQIVQQKLTKMTFLYLFNQFMTPQTYLGHKHISLTFHNHFMPPLGVFFLCPLSLFSESVFWLKIAYRNALDCIMNCSHISTQFNTVFYLHEECEWIMILLNFRDSSLLISNCS